jgi:RimJ/RimL family protein N-acetyltransferase
MPDLILRQVMPDDLPIFFENMRDPVAVRMAAFTAKDPDDRAAFDAHWARIMAADDVLNRTIVVGDQVGGSVLSYVQEGETEVSYWIGREFWGQGIATAALTAFLAIQTTRPLYARAVKDNAGSLRVLKKCGFAIIGEDKGFANGRGEEVEEYILRLGDKRGG